jgi:hypothetical protein
MGLFPFFAADGGSWAWFRGVWGNIGLIPYTTYIHFMLSADTLGNMSVYTQFIIDYIEKKLICFDIAAFLGHHI